MRCYLCSFRNSLSARGTWSLLSYGLLWWYHSTLLSERFLVHDLSPKKIVIMAVTLVYHNLERVTEWVNVLANFADEPASLREAGSSAKLASTSIFLNNEAR